MAEQDDIFQNVLDFPCQVTKLCDLTGLNPNMYYKLQKDGVIGVNPTYRVALFQIFQHYYKKNEAKIQAQEARSQEKANRRSPDYEKVMLAQAVQKIRLDKAREEGIHYENLKIRNEIILAEELEQLIDPVITNMINILRASADENPEIQPIIDKIFKELNKLGNILNSQVEVDEKDYVHIAMNTEIDLDEILNTDI